MAAVIGDFVSDPSRFHTMSASPGIPHQHPHDSHYRSASRSRDVPAHQSAASSRYHHSATTGVGSSASTPPTRQKRPNRDSSEKHPNRDSSEKHPSPTGAVSRLPSPPSSSSPTRARPQYADSPACMATGSRDTGNVASNSTADDPDAASTLGQHNHHRETNHQQPSPASEGKGLSVATTSCLLSDTSSPRQSSPSQTIHVRDLAHIQTLAKADLLPANGPGILNDPPSQAMKYEISDMPIGDIIEMVAALLTKITTTNDLQHDAMQRNVAHQQQASQNNESGPGSQMSPLSTSVLAFHGKNIPAITIRSYLSRIHKYCPTTYEVFLSLLVYFDRMTERVNEMVVKHEELRSPCDSPPTSKSSSTDIEMQDADDDHDVETDSEIADDDDGDGVDEEDSNDNDKDDTDNLANEKPSKTIKSAATVVPQSTSPGVPAMYFVVDSFNIHRLIITGVTCASKFFSDVFYTNSRYAKVGGLPLAELNHLELQFLLLNDFRLAVPVEDLEAYGTMLVEFYAREVVAADQSRHASDDDS